MSAAGFSSVKPRWYLVPVRVLLITFTVTLISFAVSLLLGIAGVLIAAGMRGVRPDMTFAYRHVAVPAAAIVAPIVLLFAIVMETRHYHQAKALQQMEQSSAK
jgi:hypothetical protein